MDRHLTGDLRYANRGFRARLEQSNALRHIIGGLAIVGVSMVMADGVLTPAQSGMYLSAADRVREAAPSNRIE